ncbi:unnamed protein product, partial [Aphanomyces euteiches]
MLDKDAWLISITERPVIPLPTHAGSRLFSADTLWNVLHSTFGHVMMANLAHALPGLTTSVLLELQKLGFRYSEQRTAISFTKTTLSGVSRSTFPGSDTQELQILTANINVLKDNGHKLAEGLLKHHNVVALQETKIAHRFQHDTFRFHLDHALGVGNYLLATNDQRHTQDSSEQHRSSGVMMLFHKVTPGFARLVHNKALDIPNKYMVVHTWWEDTPVFFHNVYAPVQNQEREAFFDALPRDFPVNAQHIIMGDFNLPLQRELDAMDPSS